MHQYRAVVKEAVKRRVQAVIFGGDLSPKCQYRAVDDYYGTMQAEQRAWILKDFAEALAPLREAGIPCYCIVGNGDVSANYDCHLLNEREGLYIMVDARRLLLTQQNGVRYELVGSPFVPFSGSSMKDFELHDCAPSAAPVTPAAGKGAEDAAGEAEERWESMRQYKGPLGSSYYLNQRVAVMHSLQQRTVDSFLTPAERALRELPSSDPALPVLMAAVKEGRLQAAFASLQASKGGGSGVSSFSDLGWRPVEYPPSQAQKVSLEGVFSHPIFSTGKEGGEASAAAAGAGAAPAAASEKKEKEEVRLLVVSHCPPFGTAADISSGGCRLTYCPDATDPPEDPGDPSLLDKWFRMRPCRNRAEDVTAVADAMQEQLACRYCHELLPLNREQVVVANELRKAGIGMSRGRDVEDSPTASTAPSPAAELKLLPEPSPFTAQQAHAASVNKRLETAECWNHLHVGSVALRKYIEEQQPFITLHGHIHETVDISQCPVQYVWPAAGASASGSGGDASTAEGKKEEAGSKAATAAELGGSYVIASGNDPLYTSNGQKRGGKRLEKPTGKLAWAVLFDISSPGKDSAWLELSA